LRVVRSVERESGFAKHPTHLPQDLKLVNDKPGHYCVAPTQNMPVDLYKGLLEQMGLKTQKAWMKAA